MSGRDSLFGLRPAPPAAELRSRVLSAAARRRATQPAPAESEGDWATRIFRFAMVLTLLGHLAVSFSADRLANAVRAHLRSAAPSAAPGAALSGLFSRELP